MIKLSPQVVRNQIWTRNHPLNHTSDLNHLLLRLTLWKSNKKGCANEDTNSIWQFTHRIIYHQISESISAYAPVLKNAIDWGSRPEGQNAWEGMPAAVVGTTLYNLGAFGAQQHLRQVLMYLNMPTLQQPEFYLEKAAEKFDSDGTLTDKHTKAKIEEPWGVFVVWAKRNKP